MLSVVETLITACLVILITQKCFVMSDSGQEQYFAMLDSFIGGDRVGRSGRLVVAILARDVIPADYDNDDAWQPVFFLCEAMKGLRNNLSPKTPSDILLFVPEPQHREENDFQVQPLSEHQLSQLKKMFCIGEADTNVYFLPIAHEHWRIRFWESPEHHLHEGRHAPGDYLMMGQWRLRHQFTILERLGYMYALQLDTDSLITSPIKQNLVQTLKEKNITMAARTILQEFSVVSERVVGCCLSCLGYQCSSVSGMSEMLQSNCQIY